MKWDSGVTIVCEGVTDEPVLRKLVESEGLRVDVVYRMGGHGLLDARVKKYAAAARFSRWFIVRDLDQHPCAKNLKEKLLTEAPRGLSFRLAVREVEAWLLADWDAFTKFFRTRGGDTGEDPEKIPDAKRVLLEGLRQSEDPRVRSRYVREADNALAFGPEYLSGLQDYVAKAWQPRRAARRAPSLERAILDLRRLRSVRLP